MLSHSIVIFSMCSLPSFTQGYSLQLQASFSNKLTISGIKLIDPDRNVDRIRADITPSEHLTVSLNSDAIPSLNTNCFFGVWRCVFQEVEMVVVGASQHHVNLQSQI